MTSPQWLKAQQQRLAALGFYTAVVDGDWGPGSERAFELAIAAAEKAAGIKPSPYPALPAAYAWLLRIDALPLVVHEGLKLLGTREIAGARHAPEIIAWGREIGVPVPNDEQAWCGLYTAVVNKRAGKDIGDVPNVLGARNWLKFGVSVDVPALGDTLVFWRVDPSGWAGHVGFYIAEDPHYWHVLGGNQSNTVNIMRLAKVQDGRPRLLGARRPEYRIKPAAVKQYLVAGTGAISTNEA